MSDDNENENFAVGFVAILWSIFLMPLIVYRWFVQWCLWGWYIVPFFGAPSLTFGQSIIIFMVIRFLLPKSYGYSSLTLKNSKEFAAHLLADTVSSFVLSTFMLVIGAIFKMS